MSILHFIGISVSVIFSTPLDEIDISRGAILFSIFNSFGVDKDTNIGSIAVFERDVICGVGVAITEDWSHSKSGYFRFSASGVGSSVSDGTNLKQMFKQD